MNPKQFLLAGGAILVLLAVLGFAGVIGPLPENSIFGETWYFDTAENWAHLILGIVALIAGITFPLSIQKPLTVAVGVLGIAVGLYNFASTQLLGAVLQNPADLILHLVVGAWALYAGLNKRASVAM